MSPLQRKLRPCFVREEYRDNHYLAEESDDRATSDGKRNILIPEIEEWCQATFGRVPTVWFYDGSDYEIFEEYWMIHFNSVAEIVAFKMRWYEYGR